MTTAIQFDDVLDYLTEAIDDPVRVRQIEAARESDPQVRAWLAEMEGVLGLVTAGFCLEELENEEEDEAVPLAYIREQGVEPAVTALSAPLPDPWDADALSPWTASTRARTLAAHAVGKMDDNAASDVATPREPSCVAKRSDSVEIRGSRVQLPDPLVWLIARNVDSADEEPLALKMLVALPLIAGFTGPARHHEVVGLPKMLQSPDLNDFDFRLIPVTSSDRPSNEELQVVIDSEFVTEREELRQEILSFIQRLNEGAQ